MQNFYEILGIKTTATPKEIKAAYIKLMKQYHPDTYLGDKLFAEHKAAEITEAYNNLKDEKLRKNHNANITPQPQPKPEPKQPKSKKTFRFWTSFQTKWKEKFSQTNHEAMKYDIVIALFIILLLIVIIIAL